MPTVKVALGRSVDIPLGGPGSGNRGHKGRKGFRGGSAPADGPRVQAVSDMAVKNVPDKSLTKAFGSDPNKTYDFQFKVVPIGSLIPSNTATGGVNPAYDPSLQPRDRSRAASQAQIDAMAHNLTPEALLWDFHQLDKGAPIVGDDMMVESGNGRILALMRAKDLYPDKWEAYQKQLADIAAQYGIKPEELAGMKDGVLVRVNRNDMDRAAFAQEANSAAVLGMSTLEQAAVDAAKIKADWLSGLKVADGQSIDEALRAPASRDFVRSVMGEIPTNERAALMRSDGSLNRMGLWRIKAALFSKVFPGEAGGRLAETFLESLDYGIKNFENAIGDVMPKLAMAEGLIAGGNRDKGLGLMGDVSKAVDMLARLRESGMGVNTYVRQSSMFGKETNARQDRLLIAFDRASRSRKDIRLVFERYSDAIINAPDPRQSSMFGGLALTTDQLLDQMLKGLE